MDAKIRTSLIRTNVIAGILFILFLIGALFLMNSLTRNAPNLQSSQHLQEMIQSSKTVPGLQRDLSMCLSGQNLSVSSMQSSIADLVQFEAWIIIFGALAFFANAWQILKISKQG